MQTPGFAPACMMDIFLCPSTSSNDPMLRLAKHKEYDDNYFDFGFIENEDGRPKCITGLQVLANKDRKPAKLKWHCIIKHYSTFSEKG